MNDPVRQFPEVPADPGVMRQVLSENDAMMVVRFAFAAGAEGRLHNHPHVQATYVQSGRFVFTMDDLEFEVAAGDSFVIPSLAMHGCRALEPGVLIDTFAPRRNDFL